MHNTLAASRLLFFFFDMELTSLMMATNTNLSEKVLQLRLEREKCHVGELHIALIWNDIADLDLHVVAPSGEELYYDHKETKCGGWLDIDMNVSASDASMEPVENVFWASAPSGHYMVFVRNFSCHTRENTVFTDSKRAVPFRVKMTRHGEVEWCSGQVAHKQDYVCWEFDFQGSGAVGSFVVLPPTGGTEKSTLQALCDKNNVTYTKGNGYYGVVRAETISATKDMLLHDKESDTFIIGAEECRRVLNLPLNEKVRLLKKMIPDKYHLFVQSTSNNRKIPGNVHSLMRVSVKEALRHRKPQDYQFDA